MAKSIFKALIVSLSISFGALGSFANAESTAPRTVRLKDSNFSISYKRAAWLSPEQARFYGVRAIWNGKKIPLAASMPGADERTLNHACEVLMIANLDGVDAVDSSMQGPFTKFIGYAIGRQPNARRGQDVVRLRRDLTPVLGSANFEELVLANDIQCRPDVTARFIL